MAYEDLARLEFRMGRYADLPAHPPHKQAAYWAFERTSYAPYYKYRLFLATDALTWAEFKPRLNQFSDAFNTEFQGVGDGAGGGGGGGGTDDKTVLVSSIDLTPSFLINKLSAGDGIAISKQAGIDEQLVITSTIQPNQHDQVFDHTSTSPVHIYNSVLNETVEEVQINIDTAFDGTVSITVGESGTLNRLVSSTDLDPYTVGIYTVPVEYTYTVATNVQLYITKSLTTQGSGKVIIRSRLT